jgi:hypothetical protein
MAASAVRNAGPTPSRQHAWHAADVPRQLDDIYFQFDAQLTRMGHIQLQVDELRTKIGRL